MDNQASYLDLVVEVYFKMIIILFTKSSRYLMFSSCQTTLLRYYDKQKELTRSLQNENIKVGNIDQETENLIVCDFYNTEVAHYISG